MLVRVQFGGQLTTEGLYDSDSCYVSFCLVEAVGPSMFVECYASVTLGNAFINTVSKADGVKE